MADEKKIVLELEVQGISKEAEALSKVELRLQELTNAKKEYMKLAKTEAGLTDNQKQEFAALNQELTEQKQLRTSLNKELANSIKLEKAEIGSMNQLRARNAELRKEMNALNLTTKEGQQRLSAIRVEYDKNNTSIRNFDRSLSGSNTLVGEYSRGFVSSIAQIGVAMISAQAVISFVTNSFNKIKDFSSKVSELSAITGASGDDLDFLKEKALDLGAQYGKLGSDVIEAMKLVGSAKPELLKNVEGLAAMTDAVLLLSKASNIDLSQATSSLAMIMNQFGVSANDATKYVNVLAAGSKYGAVEVDYLQESITKVGTVANTAGLSIEQTTAVMELFGEKGIQAEKAGTGFKKILVELQSDAKNYTNGIFDINKAIDNNTNIGNNNMKLQKKFGEHYFDLAQILIQNKDRFQELTGQITNTSVATEQANIQMNNLQGDLNKANSAWDRFVLGLDSGNGILSNSARYLTKSFADLFTQLDNINAVDAGFMEKTESSLRVIGKLIPGMGTALDNFKKSWNSIFGDDVNISDKDIRDAKKRGIEKAKIEIENNKVKAENAKQLEADFKKQEADNLAKEIAKKQAEADKARAKKERENKEEIKIFNDKNKAELDAQNKLYDEKLALQQEFIDNTISLDEANKLNPYEQAQEEIRIQQEKSDRILQINQNEANEEKRIQSEKEEQRKILIQEGFTTLQKTAEIYTSFLDAKMQSELLAAGDNEAKKDQIRTEFAKKRQNAAIMESVINVAQGITNIWSKWAYIPWMASILTAIELAATGVQIKTIKSQKFETGGVIQTGNELPNTSKNSDNTLILAKPGEVILNENQQNRAGGADFFKRLGVPGFATGGIIGGVPSPSQSNPMLNVDSIVKGISGSLGNLRVVLNVNELNDAQDELTIINNTNAL
jgi:TP901 family phage tail tape measure protein